MPSSAWRFQSAPLTEARGDLRKGQQSRPGPGFNPLPLPKQGEMLVHDRRDASKVVSIRSPYRSKGRCAVGRCQSFGIFHVSIRSPYRSKGRFPFLDRPAPAIQGFNPLPLPKQGEIYLSSRLAGTNPLFQSAPLTEARGDACGATPWSCLLSFNPLPLPKQGEMP